MASANKAGHFWFQKSRFCGTKLIFFGPISRKKGSPFYFIKTVFWWNHWFRKNMVYLLPWTDFLLSALIKLAIILPGTCLVFKCNLLQNEKFAEGFYLDLKAPKAEQEQRFWAQFPPANLRLWHFLQAHESFFSELSNLNLKYKNLKAAKTRFYL